MEDDAPTLLDARGLCCPEPVMLLHKAIAEISEGELLRVLATDPTTERDIPQFCRFLGHTLIAQEGVAPTDGTENGEYVYTLRKGP